jgi:hypothetical protein
MLRWTAAGAVAAPTSVQIRVQRHYEARVRAGAPRPSRSLTEVELRDNILHFTAGMRGPRTAPCTTLVLSGEGVASRPDTAAALALAREQGVVYIVLHATVADLSADTLPELARRVDVLVMPILVGHNANQRQSLVAQAKALGLRVATNTVLTPGALPNVVETARALVANPPTSVTFTYPFPTSRTANPPPPAAAVAALRPALAILDAAGLPARIKGLPACLLGPDAHRLGRTTNRWYVDADHQRGDALVFFPDVVAFHKDDACRFCAADGRCDGFFSRWLAREGAPKLQPL